uniref:BZIP domain-containing protein n=1 Tax=Steinernema glaseri TaxID=37863 RepID=A0A1I8AIE8_9BILA
MIVVVSTSLLVATMTSPFDADEFMKRSLFSSLVGFKKKTPKPTVYTAPAVLHQPEHLPYYRAPPPPQHARQPLPHPGYFSFDAPCSSRSRTLSDELTDSLLQAETPEVTPKSPQDIYREIVSECAEIEMGQSTPNPYVEPASCALSPLPTPQPLQFTGAEEQMAQCHIADVEPKPEPRSPGTNVSLEEFIKIVVTAVKEVGGIGAKAANKEMETPEEILRRKRQQNNEAAARYRKRQREAKQCASQELAELTEKNNGLKQQVQSLNEEIERLKAMVLQKPSS